MSEEEIAEDEQCPAVEPGSDPKSLFGPYLEAGDFFHPKSTASAQGDLDVSEILALNLAIPVEGVTAEQLRDSFQDRRGSRRSRREHLALDIGAPRGTPVVAAADGKVVQMHRERRGGKALYLRDSSGKYQFYYCHLSRYAKGLRAGDAVGKGQVLGYVGATGNAHGSHLHFSVIRLPDDGSGFKRGLAINPYLLFILAAKP